MGVLVAERAQERIATEKKHFDGEPIFHRQSEGGANCGRLLQER